MAATADSLRTSSVDKAETAAELLAAEWKARIDERLLELFERYCGHSDVCPRLAGAMRYGLITPGKRVRPLLCLMAAIDLGADPEPLLDFGCALEMVHSASLMLDDLPCMDDARLRRGQPAAHLKFGDAITTLAAVGLLNQAYGVVARAKAPQAGLSVELVARLSDAVGTAGLVSGQSRDLCERRSEIDCGQMIRINRQKTAVLFELAVIAGGLHAGIGGTRLVALNRFACQVGLAFQTADDLLDCPGDSPGDSMDSGKDAGLDAGKSGSVHAVGAGVLRRRLNQELTEARRVLSQLGVEKSMLTQYVEALFQRHLT